MTPVFHSFANWLADYYLLSSVLLACALVALAAIKQPAQRRAVTQSTLIALCLLAILCALPGWSMVSLITRQHAAPADEPLAQLLNTKQENTETRAPTDQTSVVPLAAPAIRQPSSSDAVVPDAARQRVSWPAIAVLVWSAGALSVVFWLALGLMAARRLRRNSHAVPIDLVAILREVTDTDRSRRLNVDLRMSEQLEVAVALGIRRPAVLLPAKWISPIPLS